MFSVIQA